MKYNLTILESVGLSLAGLLMMTSCAGRKYTAVDHLAYTKLPDATSSKIWRFIAKTSPIAAKDAFHGNWGGSGNLGGKPIDHMDEGFRRHDIVYYESRYGKHVKLADQELIAWLEAIDESTLEPHAQKYRRTAIKFMSSPIAQVVGKPPATMLRKEEREGCYFTSPERVASFFDPEHHGFPYTPEEMERMKKGKETANQSETPDEKSNTQSLKKSSLPKSMNGVLKRRG